MDKKYLLAFNSNNIEEEKKNLIIDLQKWMEIKKNAYT